VNAMLDDDVYELSDEAPVELRILHGAQAGSRLCLSVGEYTLGSDDSCTLILEGNGIEDRHAMLRFDGHAVWIEPLDGVVRNAHGDEIDDEHELTFGLPVELGNVWISVDREDAPWPDPKSVIPIGVSGKADAEKSLAQEFHGETGAEGSKEALATADELFTAPPKRSRKLTHALLLMLLVIAGGFGAFSFIQANHVKPVIEVASPVAEVEPDIPPPGALDMLKDFPGTTLVAQHEKGLARWVVNGYVAKVEQQRELSNLLASIVPTIQSKVLVEEELVQGARQILAGEAAAGQVRVASATGGVLQLTGAAASANEIQRIEERLLASVTGISAVKSKILLPGQLGKLLRDRIAAANLGDRLAITKELPEMTLAGRLTMEEIRRWEDLLVAFNREYGNVLPIRATVTRLIPKPPVGVQAIVGGAVPYIVTQAGEHVNQGGDVNGHTLVSVKDGEVVFEGRQRVRISR
jgi:type III secretion system YscD/HrpQ family protein